MAESRSPAQAGLSPVEMITPSLVGIVCGCIGGMLVRFVREVQPVLDRYCAGCHNGQAGRPNLSDPKIINTSGGISVVNW